MSSYAGRSWRLHGKKMAFSKSLGLFPNLEKVLETPTFGDGSWPEADQLYCD